MVQEEGAGLLPKSKILSIFFFWRGSGENLTQSKIPMYLHNIRGFRVVDKIIITNHG